MKLGENIHPMCILCCWNINLIGSRLWIFHLRPSFGLKYTFNFFSFWILYLLHYNNILLLFFYNHFYQTQSFHDKSFKLILSKLYWLMFKFSKFYTKLFLEHSLFRSRSFFQLIPYLLFCDNTSHFLFLQSFY